MRREADGQDKRLCHLYLTEKGCAIAPKLQQLYQELVALHIKNLTDDEAQQLIVLMEKVLNGLLQEKAALEKGTDLTSE